jgi:hypothetical protein
MMAMTQKRRWPRGISMIETIVASTVLVLGLSGITMMLLHGSANARNGQQYMVATAMAGQALHELTDERIESLVPTPGLSFDAGTALDGGYYTDGSGRPYNTGYIVTDISVPGQLIYRIDVQTSYLNGHGQTVVQRASTVISKAPDAG